MNTLPRKPPVNLAEAQEHSRLYAAAIDSAMVTLGELADTLRSAFSRDWNRVRETDAKIKELTAQLESWKSAKRQLDQIIVPKMAIMHATYTVRENPPKFYGNGR